MDDRMISGTELAIQSVEDRLPRFANGSAIPSSSSFSSSSFLLRKIEFHPARKPFSGFGNKHDFSSGDFRIETLNSDSRSHKRPLALNRLQCGKKVDGTDLVENGLDPELSLGFAFRRIGAGLENLGNTCFLNSVLQCLTYTEPLAAYLQSGKHQNTCHIAGFCALCAIQKHVSRALQLTGRSFVPKDLVSNLRCISRNFRNARQEDAHEYMVNLLESMHKCCLPSGVPSESPAAYEKSLVHKIFGGRLRSQVECQQCFYRSNKFDPFLDLSLEIYKADTLPLALRNFTAAELLDGGEKQYQCQQCKQKVKAMKRLTVHKCPYVLTIHLKRFHAHDPGRKVDKKVIFDHSLDMKPFVSDTYEGDLKYSLYGVLVHFGHNTHSGHYVCFVRTSRGIWYLLNDNEVRQVSEKKVLDQKAYMLFYVRDRKIVAPRKPGDVVYKENMKATAGNNVTNLVFKHLSNEHASNDGSVGNKALAVVNQKDSADMSKDQKGAVNFSTPKKFLQKETSNDSAISESTVRNAEPSSSLLKKDPAKEISTGSKASPGAEPLSSSSTAKIDNATVQIGAKSNNRVELPVEKLDTNEASKKINPILNGRVDEIAENPRFCQSVDSVDRISNKIDNIKLADKPCNEISQGGDFFIEIAAGNASGGKAGGRGQQNVNELVDSSLLSVEQNGCLHDESPNCSPCKKLKKKRLKCRSTNLRFGNNFFRASVALWKKKKHKKKRCILKMQNLIKEQLLESFSLSPEVGPSTSRKSMPVTFGATHLQREDNSCLKSRGDSLIETVDDGFKKRENKHQDSTDFTETSKKCKSENGMMSMLNRGLEETTVARWDGLELPSSQIMESSSIEEPRVGRVLDEWDEEYDRGKRKKLRIKQHEFGGPNPFQEIAGLKKQHKKPKMDRSSSGNKPFRI
ncbi:ubiquitin carboxyl-terminal hydrolase 23 [Euphorbia lathyris]|uniref:ubiquitin carboxyl-terminal hydrolase 23 n=1 Tax=Euphorbia lathyris TaxID=212925 RepID=UPI0033135CF9